MNKELAGSFVKKMISALSDRGGFDGWWDGIDEDIKTEIVEELAEILTTE